MTPAEMEDIMADEQRRDRLAKWLFAGLFLVAAGLAACAATLLLLAAMVAGITWGLT